MFLHMLSEDEKSSFLRTASLFCISDAPVLWDGKTETEITGETDLSEISLNISNEKKQFLKKIFQEELGASPTRYLTSDELMEYGEFSDIADEFIDSLKRLPLFRQNDITQRHLLATPMLQQLFKEQEETPSVTANKVMLFELLLLCKTGDGISHTEETLIKEFVNANDVDEFIIDELDERADAINREIVRIASLILE